MNVKRIILPFLFFIACMVANNSISQQHNKAKDPDQYRALHWTIADGLSWDRRNTMIKDSKGFIWIGSGDGGFCRFDGATFKKYLPDPNNRNTINSDKIKSFTEDSLNNIWIGTDEGISRYDLRADTFTNYSPYNNFPGAIVPIRSTKDMIFCIEQGGFITAFDIRTLKRKTMVEVSKEVEMNIQWNWNLNKSFFEATSQSIWKLKGGGTPGLEQIFLNTGKPVQYLWPCYRNNVKHLRHDAEDMVYDSKRNSIWINSGDGLLEFSLHDKQFRKIEAFNEMTETEGFDRGVGIDIGINGRVWLSTSNGIFIYDSKTKAARPIFSDPELQKKVGDANLHIYCDRDGIVWTSNWMNYGIYEVLPHNPPFERFTANPKMKDSLSNHVIYRIVPAANGEMWIGTMDGLNIFDTKTNKFRVLRQKDLPGVSGNFIVPVHVDTIRQKAWIRSTAKANNDEHEMDLYEMDLKTRQCKPIVFRDGTKLLGTISARSEWFLPYKNGLIFCADWQGVFELKENSLFADLVIPLKPGFGRMELEEDRFIFLGNLTLENRNGKWIKTPHLLDTLEWKAMLYNEKDQTHWVSFKYELVHYNKDFRKIKTYGQEDGFNGMAFNMLLDDDDNLWFANHLNQVCRLDANTGIITTISETDGYQKQNFEWVAPAAKDEQGKLYFGADNVGRTTGGLDRIHPERYLSVVTSSVYLRSLTINRDSFPLSTGINNLEELSLSYNQNTISIETGIIDFYANGKGHIRYKLKSGDKDEAWQYGPAYYSIRYEKLPPGRYELVLQASNTSNEFNSPEKKIVINISPPFWETWWFRITAAVALLLLFYGIYRWRTATLRKQKSILEQTVKERTAEVVEEKAEIERQKDVIQLEKEKSDELLLNILPSEVAQELKEKGYTTAKSFDEVTVLFSDIKGFTNVAEKLTAQELVKEIDTYFSAFDNIILKYGLEKIKTIGDAYIAAGGLPEKNAATAQNVIEAAIAMQQVVEKLKRERELSGKPYFELRIGIHTGPVVAGVVGIKKFQYDIWGDTVNLAARMDQSGVPGKINISQQTYELVKGQFNCVHRGKIEAKNKGDIDMYFVE